MHVVVFPEGQTFGAILDLELNPEAVYEMQVPRGIYSVELAAAQALRSTLKGAEVAGGESVTAQP